MGATTRGVAPIRFVRALVRALCNWLDGAHVRLGGEGHPPQYRHTKSGRRYLLICEDARLEKDLTPVVIYEGMRNGEIWVRPASEFFDGRFEEVGR